MKPRRQRLLLIVAATCALLSLVFIVWSLLTSSPLVLVMSMVAGQGLGTLSFLLYGAVVVFDLWGARLPTDEEPGQP